MVDLKNKNKGCGEKWTQWYVWSSAKKKKKLPGDWSFMGKERKK